MQALLLYDREKTGSQNQCLALAEGLKERGVIEDFAALAVPRQPSMIPNYFCLTYLKKTPFWRQLTQIGQCSVIISSGTRAAQISRYLGKQSRRNKNIERPSTTAQPRGGRPRASIKAGATPFVVNILNPRQHHRDYDMIITPLHDGLKKPNVLVTDAPLSRYEYLQAHPERRCGRTFTVLVGGPTRHTRFQKEDMYRLAHDLRQLLRNQDKARCQISFSRRTPQEFKQIIAAQLSGMTGIHTYDPAVSPEENPYSAYLAQSGAFIVTADSMSMISECASTGQPTYVVLPTEKPLKKNTKSRRFIRHMREAGYVQVFTEPLPSFTPKPLRQMDALVTAIVEQLTLAGTH